ncbi:MAG: hypothetical protein Q7R96_01595 [Nanoarchaeota archaeon]|nr:hypothetical protein [Nanoarchaeota archaeon]
MLEMLVKTLDGVKTAVPQHESTIALSVQQKSVPLLENVRRSVAEYHECLSSYVNHIGVNVLQQTSHTKEWYGSCVDAVHTLDASVLQGSLSLRDLLSKSFKEQKNHLKRAAVHADAVRHRQTLDALAEQYMVLVYSPSIPLSLQKSLRLSVIEQYQDERCLRESLGREVQDLVALASNAPSMNEQSYAVKAVRRLSWRAWWLDARELVLSLNNLKVQVAAGLEHQEKVVADAHKLCQDKSSLQECLQKPLFVDKSLLDVDVIRARTIASSLERQELPSWYVLQKPVREYRALQEKVKGKLHQDLLRGRSLLRTVLQEYATKPKESGVLADDYVLYEQLRQQIEHKSGYIVVSMVKLTNAVQEKKLYDDLLFSFDTKIASLAETKKRAVRIQGDIALLRAECASKCIQQVVSPHRYMEFKDDFYLRPLVEEYQASVAQALVLQEQQRAVYVPVVEEQEFPLAQRSSFSLAWYLEDLPMPKDPRLSVVVHALRGDYSPEMNVSLARATRELIRLRAAGVADDAWLGLVKKGLCEAEEKDYFKAHELSSLQMLYQVL